MKKTDLLKTLTEQLNSLNYSQVETLFILYQVLNSNFDFFMTEDHHIKLIDFYFNRIRIKNIDSIKSLLYLAITQYTYESRYVDLLSIFDMMKNNYSYNQILNIICSKYL